MGKVDEASQSVSGGYYLSIAWALLSVSYLCADILSLLDLSPRSSGVDRSISYVISTIFIPIAGIVTVYFVYQSDIKAKKYWLFLIAGMLVTHIGKLVLSQHGAWTLLPYAIAAILATYVYLGFYKVLISEAMDASMVRKRNTYILLLGLVIAAIHFLAII